MQRFQAWKKLVEEGPMKTSSRFEVYQRVAKGIAELVDFIGELACDSLEAEMNLGPAR
jgi:hypothetical protein